MRRRGSTIAMEDLSFIPNLLNGPLDVYRNTSSFDWKRLKLALEGDIQLLRLKYKIWHTLENDPLFAHNIITPPVEEQKRITQMQLQKINQYKFFTDEIFNAGYKKRTRTLMTINEAVQSLAPSVSVKMAIGIYLFSNAILSLGTERHRQFYEATIKDRKYVASFALTEIAHGSDAKLMRTTSTYDPKTKEFVIHTPDFEAAKCWVGNLGRTCTHTLLFAQLITPDGKNHGLHGFLVPIRDPHTLEVYPGLIVGDMGEKIGVNGIDNGFVMFNKYRIPRVNLLNRIADVTEEGVYESSFSEPSRILGAALENLSAGRIGIMQESCHSIASLVAIAIRYAATRKQFGERQNETALIEYELHQWRLFGYVAAAVVFRFYLQNFANVYLQIVEKSNSGDGVDNLTEAVSEIHAMVSCSKPLLTWTVLEAAQQCREACGGHGYLKVANIGDIRSNHEPTVTYEGDNNVLSQQTGNWLLKQYEAVLNGHDVDSPLGTVTFLKDIKTILNSTFTCKSTEELKNPKFILATYKWLLCWLIKYTHEKNEAELAKGLTKMQARSQSQVYRWRTLTKVYAEYLALIFCLESIEKTEAQLLPVLKKLFCLYGLWSLDKHLVEMYQGGFSKGEELARLLRAAILEMCADLKTEVVSVVDALAPTDFVLNSVLGKSDGNLYQHLQKAFFSHPGAFERATWWRDVVKSKL
ncbi:peroxisomal acyl-coenzyme A oxidase 3 isoform X1 [Pieris rapae]|uniref:peroxisomal acyl-coenzyme A oxidase 3 isoform X1 n=2 Tax=Pieris rapae TaxID=64459 RepID=UPI001E2813FA|nr:peroxisomal acyl-coenzyme A oxidase 3 isoform X1 [Pieris rapae]